MTSTPGRSPERIDSGVVGPVAAPYQERALVEPDGIPALGHRGRVQPAGDGDPCLTKSAAIASGSPRLPSLPGRRRMAPSSETIAGS